MADLFPPSLAQQIGCVEREIRMRAAVYPRQVARGKMNQDDADRELAAMRAVLETLRRVRVGETRPAWERNGK